MGTIKKHFHIHRTTIAHHFNGSQGHTSLCHFTSSTARFVSSHTSDNGRNFPYRSRRRRAKPSYEVVISAHATANGLSAQNVTHGQSVIRSSVESGWDVSHDYKIRETVPFYIAHLQWVLSTFLFLDLNKYQGVESTVNYDSIIQIFIAAKRDLSMCAMECIKCYLCFLLFLPP